MRRLEHTEFRSKMLRGARIEDLYFYLELLKTSSSENYRVAEILQIYIEDNLDYIPRERRS